MVRFGSVRFGSVWFGLVGPEKDFGSEVGPIAANNSCSFAVTLGGFQATLVFFCLWLFYSFRRGGAYSKGVIWRFWGET